MPVTLRKRKTPPPQPERATKKKGGPKAAVSKAKDAVKEKLSNKPKPKETAPAVPATAASPTPATGPSVGDVITLAGFGGEVETNDGKKTTLEELVKESKNGVVLFTYPKASTPGCTTQVCLFRDAYEPLTATGLSIFGLSNDSTKANTTFKTKQNLPYPLLCNPSSSLIEAIGLVKQPKGTKRGVFVVSKEGKVLAAEGGGPQATVDVVKSIVGDSAAPNLEAKVEAEEKKAEEKKEEDKKVADVADAVADTAQKIDSPEAEKKE